MSQQRFPMTPAGKDRLARELDRLRRERPVISAQIEEARAHGDLRENAEYHAAKEKQGITEARIREYEAKLAMAQVIDPTKLSGAKIRFGATVTLLETATEKQLKYSIVGEDEADFKVGLLNYQSPIARGLLGKDEGDDVEINTGAGNRSFEILKVEYVEILLPSKDG